MAPKHESRFTNHCSTMEEGNLKISANHGDDGDYPDAMQV